MLWTLVIFLGVTYGAKLPTGFKRCKLSDPNLDDCLKRNVQDALDNLWNGIPNFGIPPLEPLSVSSVEIKGGNGAIRFDQKYTHAKLKGLSKGRITKYKANLDEYRLYTESYAPSIEFVGDYELSGRALLLPVQGKGWCNITMVDLKTKHYMVGESYEMHGKKYMKIKDYDIVLEPGLVITYFDNLFNGNKALGDNLNNFMNENWRDVFRDIRPGYEETFGLIFKGIANRIFTRVPFRDIFI